MTELAADAFRTVGAERRDRQRLRRSLLPGRSQAPGLDRARRRPPLRVRRPLHVRRRAMPALRRPAHRDDDHVPVPRLPVRHHDRRRDQRPGDRAADRLRGAGGRRRHPDPRVSDEASDRRTTAQQTRLALGAMLIPTLLRDHVRGLHHRHLPQAASERHQGRRRRAARRRRRQLRAGLAKAAGSALRHQSGDDARRKRRTTSASATSTRPSCRPRTRSSPRP